MEAMQLDFGHPTYHVDERACDRHMALVKERWHVTL
jgi:hypothetical protein